MRVKIFLHVDQIVYSQFDTVHPQGSMIELEKIGLQSPSATGEEGIPIYGECDHESFARIMSKTWVKSITSLDHVQ